MSDNDATQARQDVAADVDEIIEHVINANMLSMPYDVYSELFDAVDGLGVKIEKLQSENAKLRERLQAILGNFLDGYMSDSSEYPCDLCDEWGPCSIHEDGRCMFYEQLRALGIEVPT